MNGVYVRNEALAPSAEGVILETETLLLRVRHGGECREWSEHFGQTCVSCLTDLPSYAGTSPFLALMNFKWVAQREG